MVVLSSQWVSLGEGGRTKRDQVLVIQQQERPQGLAPDLGSIYLSSRAAGREQRDGPGGESRDLKEASRALAELHCTGSAVG